LTFKFINPKFIKSAVLPKDYPPLRTLSGQPMPEIAVSGRSNVGKSSLINHLLRTRGLAKTSATPGKTQVLNFFTVNNDLGFVDLPGYGFANVPPVIRKKWGPMVQNYLEKRETLQLVLFLFDIRRIPNDDDRQLLEWISQSGKAMILVLTKTDKISKGQIHPHTERILKELAAANVHTVQYSVPKNIGRAQLIRMINDAFYGVSP
jgi:GTP-binding protein